MFAFIGTRCQSVCCQVPVREQLQDLATLQTNDFFLLNRAIYLLNDPTFTIHITLQSCPSYHLRTTLSSQNSYKSISNFIINFYPDMKFFFSMSKNPA